MSRHFPTRYTPRTHEREFMRLLAEQGYAALIPIGKASQQRHRLREILKRIMPNHRDISTAIQDDIVFAWIYSVSQSLTEELRAKCLKKVIDPKTLQRADLSNIDNAMDYVGQSRSDRPRQVVTMSDLSQGLAEMARRQLAEGKITQEEYEKIIEGTND